MLSLDLDFILYRVTKYRKNLIFQFDGGNEEINKKIRRALVVTWFPEVLDFLKHQDLCRRWISVFWERLAKEEDLTVLPTTVATIEREEVAAG